MQLKTELKQLNKWTKPALHWLYRSSPMVQLALGEDWSSPLFKQHDQYLPSLCLCSASTDKSFIHRLYTMAPLWVKRYLRQTCTRMVLSKWGSVAIACAHIMGLSVYCFSIRTMSILELITGLNSKAGHGVNPITATWLKIWKAGTLQGKS